jgi:hypothetical protein
MYEAFGRLDEKPSAIELVRRIERSYRYYTEGDMYASWWAGWSVGCGISSLLWAFIVLGLVYGWL